MEDKKYVITEEELKEIAGGTTKVNGLNCPTCGTLIQISLNTINNNNSIVCPKCGLKLEIRNNPLSNSELAAKKYGKLINNNNKSDVKF